MRSAPRVFCELASEAEYNVHVDICADADGRWDCMLRLRHRFKFQDGETRGNMDWERGPHGANKAKEYVDDGRKGNGGSRTWRRVGETDMTLLRRSSIRLSS